MKPENKPLIYILNTDISVENKLKSVGFNAHHYWLNGREYINTSLSHCEIPYEYDFPSNLHEAEIIVFDTAAGSNHRPAQDSALSVYYSDTPTSVNFLPLDMHFAINNINSSQRKQCLVVFCGIDEEANYEVCVDGHINSRIQSSSNCFYDHISISSRTGSRLEVVKGSEEKDIKNCLSKYLSESHYELIFDYPIDNVDTPLLSNDAGQVVGMLHRGESNKIIIFLPQINNKEDLLSELFDKVLPEHPDFSNLFPNNGSFSWMSKPSYISIEERNKIVDIENEYKRHEEAIQTLKEQFDEIHSKEENVKLRNILIETGDELVSSVKWFLEYIGFEKIINPDDNVNEGAGELFEEDLNFEYDGLHFILEIKGLGGTSTDSQCGQISKIELRRRKQDADSKYKSVYIVNHQRFKEPKARQLIPFTPEQVENAEMTYRGMTFTYELFDVYHMLEKGILRKDDVRESFKQDGVIDFRRTLNRLSLKSCLKRYTAYSFNLDGSVSITKADKIAIQDNQDHWHLLDIVNIQVNNADVEEAAAGSAGIQVSQLVDGARDYYLVKA